MVTCRLGRVLGTSSVLVASCVALLASCKKESSQSAAPVKPAPTTTAKAPTPAAEPGQWYRARLMFDGIGELPFFLHVPPIGQNGRAYVVNGTETAEFKAEWRDNEVSIIGPWAYTSLIEATVKPHDTKHKLEGTWTRDTPLWGQVVRTFIAEPIDAPDPTTRFAVAAKAKPAQVAGTWKFEFETHKEGKGVLQQDADGVVRGYIKPGQLGDIRFLAGNVDGDKVSLSTFNGNSANLVLGTLSADGKTMTGMMSMQNVWNEKFTATRVGDDYKFVNKVHLKDGATRVSLKGLDKYRGKPTLAIIFATWCSSCNDAYPFLKQLYAKYHPQGLEAYGVAYDLSEDEKTNLAELDEFRAKHAIPWALIQVPSTPETWAKAMPPELEGWDGLPILLLVRADGTVQDVLGGWLGPATGADGERLQQWFEQQTQQLVKDASPEQHAKAT